MAGIPMRRNSPGSGLPKASLSNMRSVIGPFAGSVLLHQSLESCVDGHKLNWAVNHYFRKEFSKLAATNGSSRSIFSSSLNISQSTKNCDFYPRLPTVDENKQNPPATDNTEFKPYIMSLADEMICRILSWLDIFSVMSTSGSNKRIHGILLKSPYGELVWLGLLESACYIKRMSEVANNASIQRILFVSGIEFNSGIGLKSQGIAAETEYVCNSGTADHIYDIKGRSAMADYKHFFFTEMSMSCPGCSALGSVVPVIYGFPSEDLFAAHQRGWLRMGGDNLLDGAANWTCKFCDAQFFTYPYRCCIVTCSSPAESSTEVAMRDKEFGRSWRFAGK